MSVYLWHHKWSPLGVSKARGGCRRAQRGSETCFRYLINEHAVRDPLVLVPTGRIVAFCSHVPHSILPKLRWRVYYHRHHTLIQFPLSPVCPERTHSSFHTNSS